MDVGARGSASSVVGTDGEGLVFWVVLRLGLEILVECHGSSGAYHASSDLTRLVAEDEAGDDVEEANDNGQDTRSDEQAPERQSERLLARGLLVHVTEHVESNHHHCATQRDETMRRTQERPVTSVEVAEQRAF